MDEILKKLLESDLLSEDTRAQITEEWEKAVAAFKEQVEVEARSSLVEQFTKDRDALVEKVEQSIQTWLATEAAELDEDIERFRDLEAEMAEKLVEEKQKLAVKLGEEIDQLVDKIDAFLEYRLSEELAELDEDIAEIRKNDFGRRVFEAFQTEFGRSFTESEDSMAARLAELEDRLADAEGQLKEAEQEQKRVAREKKLDEVLAPLAGVKREQMEILLSTVDTAKLQEAYNLFIGRILKEDVDGKTKEVVTESVTEVVVENKVVTGNENVEDSNVITENSELQRILRLAGLK